MSSATLPEPDFTAHLNAQIASIEARQDEARELIRRQTVALEQIAFALSRAVQDVTELTRDGGDKEQVSGGRRKRGH